MVLGQFLYTKKKAQWIIYLFIYVFIISGCLLRDWTIKWILPPLFPSAFLSLWDNFCEHWNILNPFLSKEQTTTVFLPRHTSSDSSHCVPKLQFTTDFFIFCTHCPTSSSLTCVWTHWNWLCPFTGQGHVSLNPKGNISCYQQFWPLLHMSFFFFLKASNHWLCHWPSWSSPSLSGWSSVLAPPSFNDSLEDVFLRAS